MPTYPFTLTMLSPVHIGTGEEIDPNEYVVVEEKRGDVTEYIVDVIDLPAFLGSLTPELRREFDDAVSRNAIFYVRRFIADRCDTRRFRRYSCSTNEEFYNLYREGLTRDASQLQVNTMTRTGADARPYIPGSSLKGSIRTAVVAVRAAEAERRKPGSLESLADREFEPVVLGYRNERGRPEIRADPFRAVRITDAPLPSDTISIDPAEIFAPGRAAGSPDPAGIQMYYEMTFSALDNQTVQARGTIAIDDRLATQPAPRGRGWDFDHCVSQRLTIEEILGACRLFYVDRLEKENEDFYQKHGQAAKAGERLRALAGAMKGNETLIRLGRFSHFECVTVGPPFARPPKRDAGRTRTLAAGELPMGWAKLTIDGM